MWQLTMQIAIQWPRRGEGTHENLQAQTKSTQKIQVQVYYLERLIWILIFNQLIQKS